MKSYREKNYGSMFPGDVQRRDSPSPSLLEEISWEAFKWCPFIKNPHFTYCSAKACLRDRSFTVEMMHSDSINENHIETIPRRRKTEDSSFMQFDNLLGKGKKEALADRHHLSK